MQPVFRLPVTGKPGKTAGFRNRKTGFVRTQKNGFGGFNFGYQNCTEKRAEMYFIWILEAKLIAFATQILTSKFLVKVHSGLVQTNIFGVILCNLHNVICSYCFVQTKDVIRLSINRKLIELTDYRITVPSNR